MRVNIYAEEMTDRVEIITKEIEGQSFTGLRLYLELPVTLPQTVKCPECNNGFRGDPMQGGGDYCEVCGGSGQKAVQAQGPFIHQPGDDDSAAVTFWGKRDLRLVLRKMLEELDAHYDARGYPHVG